MQNKCFIKEAIFMIASFLFLSCAKNDLLTESKLSTAQISFKQNNTSCQLINYKAGVSDFYVFGYHTGDMLFQDYVNSGITPKSDWMFNQNVSRNELGQYVYSPISYWPANENDKITFLSYTYSSNAAITQVSPDPITKLGEPRFKFTTKIEDPTGDFLVSQPAYDLTRNSGSVKFYLQHVLSKTRFNIKSTGVNVKIKSIGLKNVYTEAEFLAHGRVWSKFANKADLKTYVISELEQNLTDKFKLLSPYYVIIPQSIENSIIKPTFVLMFEEDGVEKTLEFIPSRDWRIYESYTYNITYTAGKIEVLTDFEPWVENDVTEDISANQYLNVSTRELDLANSHHFYYNSSFPSTSVDHIAIDENNLSFNLYDYFNVYFEGYRVRLEAIFNGFLQSSTFTIYIQGLDLHGHVSVRIPIKVKIDSGGGVEIDGTYWAHGNIICIDGQLDIAPNSSYTGLYFRWGSLIGLAGNNAKSFQFLPDKTIGFRPAEFKKNINKWDEVPYEHTMGGYEYDDAFSGKYNNKLGFDTESALGDPCRYMSNQNGWTKGKWRMPTKAEYDAIVIKRKVRKINGTWGIANESHEHISATTGTLAVEAGWFVKVDTTDISVPPDSDFSTVKPPKGWVFYPATGERSGYTGILSQYSSSGFYWTASTVSWGAAYRFQFSNRNTGNNLGSFNYIASGFVDAHAVRCVRDINK